MKLVLSLALCYTVVHGQKRSPIQLPAADENYFVNLQQKYLDEHECIKKFDAILTTKWTQDLQKISTKDLGSLEPRENKKEPSKPMYRTYEQEWLMESGSTAKKIESCLRDLVPEVVPLMSQEEIDCLNAIFAFHIEEEFVHEEIFEETLKKQGREQLPFRRFISFTEFAELLFESRTPDALGDHERGVYEHAESYLTTDQDRVNPTYIIEQGCEWKNARALREIFDVDRKLNEFVRQARDSVNQQLAKQLMVSWDVKSTLPRDRYVAWLQARHKMMPKIIGEVKKLQNQKKDPQWLCERATEFASELSEEQASILLSSDRENEWSNYHSTGFEISNITVKARTIEKAMEKIHDFRHPTLKTLADKYEDGELCLSAFLHLVQNHRRFDIALAFVDGEYNYPEFYCKEDYKLDSEIISPRFCKCVGSFCVYHGLARFNTEDYILVEGPNGTYKVVATGVRTERQKKWNAAHRD